MAPPVDRLLVSVHDVMPETLQRVGGVLRVLEGANLAPATLLVVPGKRWSDGALAELRRHADRGHELAGHGWRHAVDRVRGPAHRLHRLVISRDTAEHLALDAAGIASLIRRCRRWFEENHLPTPRLYVPPAWAMGSIRPGDLAGLGFRCFEFLGGIYDTASSRMHRIPLLGFEADTPWRAGALRVSNALNRIAAGRTGLARLAVHPHDLDLKLARDLRATLREGHTSVGIDAVLGR